MPTEAEQKRNRKVATDIFKGLPVPVPGSATGILDEVRQKIMEASEKAKKKKQKEKAE